ncbi:MAG: hypothetical protein ACRBF0_04515 [Calditrichia bacterium]
MKRILLYTSLAGLTLLIGAAAVLQKGPFKKQRNWPQHPVDAQMIKAAENFFEVSVSPEARYSYAIMKPGVIQHLDRRYTYDFIPDDLLNGVLFQGLHRPPAGTELTIKTNQLTDIYFFFHHTVDGGYGKIFKQLSQWKKMPIAPQYDIKSKRGHGLKMIMYHLRATPGEYKIPPTTADRACFNIVFKLPAK